MVIRQCNAANVSGVGYLRKYIPYLDGDFERNHRPRQTCWAGLAGSWLLERELYTVTQKAVTRDIV